VPIQANGAQEGGAGELIVVDVVDLDPAGVHVAQDHVGFAPTCEIAETHHLPIQSYRPQQCGVSNEVVADVVDLEAAGG